MNDLDRKAKQMKALARKNGLAVSKDAERDLSIILGYNKAYGVWSLSLISFMRPPLQEYQDLYKSAFAVPADHEWKPTYKDGRGIVKFIWRDVQLVQAPLMPQAARAA